MCTALTLESYDNCHFFGRNMDIEYEFNQSVLLVPRNFEYYDRVNNQTKYSKYAILGMGTVVENHPLFADGFNEKGLACAGLNFPNYAYYEPEFKENMQNVSPYDFIFWILGNFSSVSDLESKLNEVNLIDKPFSKDLPLAPLHWIVYDKSGKCIVIEKTRENFKVFQNNVGVLSNSPTFNWHMTNLNHYINLNNKNPDDIVWHNEKLKPLGEGFGLIGLPGDFSPASRFVRSAFLKSNAKFLQDKTQTLATFFSILDNLAMVNGSVITKSGLPDITLYSTSMCLEDGIYYYKTYKNSQLNAINMHKYDLNSKEIKMFKFINEQSINFLD